MKVQVLGVKRIAGRSAKTGNQYDICSLLALTPVESGGGKDVTITGYGYELAEMTLDPACLEQFASVKFPAQLDLQVEPRPFRGKFEMCVVGLVPAHLKAAS